ncbi:hypothetical protein ACE1CI_16400 [Aerosakkonemataceae cyanobacterium BLCC-F50]|uniref:Uncharacterized protein n=1 Tax=Floridaenema flaviceps BLCC-F50 TaxID=3153642 RepID=A0ABV4XSQ8_9CYAN
MKAEVLELKKQQKQALAQEVSNVDEARSSPLTVTDKPKPALKKKVVVQPETEETGGSDRTMDLSCTWLSGGNGDRTKRQLG